MSARALERRTQSLDNQKVRSSPGRSEIANLRILPTGNWGPKVVR